jgi:hypothetical protein
MFLNQRKVELALVFFCAIYPSEKHEIYSLIALIQPQKMNVIFIKFYWGYARSLSLP